MAGSSRTGLWITIILECSGQVLELWSIPFTTQGPQQCPVSSRRQCIGYTSGGEAVWQQISNFHQHFWPFFSDGQLLSLDVVCLQFSAIGCLQNSWYFAPLSHLIVIYFSLLEFLVATAWPCCFAWLLQYRSSSCAVSNSFEGGHIKSKSCSLFMINDQNFLTCKNKVLLHFCHVFSKPSSLFQQNASSFI